MIKIIQLGSEIPETGESRVQLMDDSLIKTASNDIQNKWASLDKDPNKSYLHVIAMTDSTKYGPNNNGDFFYGDDLRKYHPSFIENAYVFLHHVNKDPKKSLGKPIYSFYNENMHRVELILAIDKDKPLSAKTVASIKADEDIYVSMGVKVSHDICSICGNKARTRKEYCTHLRYNMKKILPDGRQVYAINPAPLKFFDISVVSKPADKVAWALEKAASEGNYQEDKVFKLSADLGEEYALEKVAREGIQKLSELIKYVDGDITKLKDSEDNVKSKEQLEVIRDLGKKEIRHLDYPTLSFDEMEDLEVSPGGLLKGVASCHAPISLSELAFASGKHHLGKGFREHHITQMLGMLPAILSMLERNPKRVFSEAEKILGDTSEDFNDNEVVIRIQRKLKPVADSRIKIIKLACQDHLEELEKVAGTAAQEYLNIPTGEYTPEISTAKGFLDQLNIHHTRDKASHAPGVLSEYTITGTDGKDYKTNWQAIMAAKEANNPPNVAKKLIGATVGLASLGAILNGKTMAEKTVLAPGLLLALQLMKDNPETLKTHQGVEVPANTTFTEISNSITKTANTLTGKAAGIAKNNLWPTAAMTVPAALGLDYLYNKNIKYRKNPQAQFQKSRTDKVIDGVGKFVTDHPVLTIGGTGVASSTLAEHLKTIRRLR
jgi:hypothetical protein